MIRLRVVDEQRWLEGCGYGGCVVLVLSQIDVVGRLWHIVTIQTTEDGINYSTRDQDTPHEKNTWMRLFGRALRSTDHADRKK